MVPKHIKYTNALLIVLMFTTVALLVTFPLQDYDTFWHIANGRAMIQNQTIINSEIFSYTNFGKTFHNHEWLSQIILFEFYNHFGVAGLIGLKVLLTLPVCYFLFKSIRSTGGSIALAALLCWLAVQAGLPRYLVRPQLFSFLGVTILGFIIHGYRAKHINPKWLYALPIIMVLWDFLHGAIYGLVFLAAVFMGEILSTMPGWDKINRNNFRILCKENRLLVWILASFLAMLINPYGLLSYDIFLDFVNGKNLMALTTAEFQPTTWQGFVPFWLLLAGTTISFLIAFKKRKSALQQRPYAGINLVNLFIFLPFAALAIRFQRSTAVFALAAMPILVDNVAGLPLLSSYTASSVYKGAKSKIWRYLLGGLIIMAVIYSAYFKFLLPQSNLTFGCGLNNNILPVASARFIKKTGLSGHMFNTDRYGGVLAYFLSPERKIFHYNNHELFNYAQSYFHRPDSIIKQWGINYAIVGYKSELDMFRHAGFIPVYWEAAAAVLLKDTPANKKIIDRYRITYFRPLMNNEELLALATDPAVLPILAREISDYLSFRPDNRVANALAKIIVMPASNFPVAEKVGILAAAEKYNQDNANLLEAEGVLLYRLQKVVNAKEKLSKALRLNASLLVARINYAYIEYDQNNFTRAIRDFDKALQNYPNNRAAIYGLALSYYSNGEYKLASLNFDKYLTINHDGRWADSARKHLQKIRDMNK